MKALVDNDVLIKGSCYGLLDALLSSLPPATGPVGVLGAARFVGLSSIKKRLKGADAEAARARFLAFVESANALEPTGDELRIAADLEYQAQRLQVALDSGESQLCAVLVSRVVPTLATGDKRAIAAIEALRDPCAVLAGAEKKLICLEQLLLRLLKSKSADEIRGAICRTPDIDKALSISFCCYSASAPAGACEEALESYIRDLRKSAARVLAPD